MLFNFHLTVALRTGIHVSIVILTTKAQLAHAATSPIVKNIHAQFTCSRVVKKTKTTETAATICPVPQICASARSNSKYFSFFEANNPMTIPKKPLKIISIPNFNMTPDSLQLSKSQKISDLRRYAIPMY